MQENKAILSNVFSSENLLLEEVLPQEDYLFFEDGKKAINYIMSELGMNREDEVAILTTSDSSFVSSCVTCNIFNYSKISRTINSNTKLIYVIHEFGFPFEDIENIAIYAKNNNIILVEDSAHSMDSYVNGKRLGSFGNYAIFSLPKTFPINRGGLLV
ncbi:MAG: DegT/DnrJ/EryC1/StrS family aminotransferase, partial [Bacteroidia bacterium]